MILTGSWWVDGPIIGAALLTAYLTLWKKGARPLLHAAKFLVGLRDELAHIHDCMEIVKRGQANLQVSFTKHRDEFSELARKENEARMQVVEVAKTVHAPVVIPEEGG